MFEYMEELSVTETENLRKTISNLFRQTCILQVKYDPVTLTPIILPYIKTFTSPLF